MFSGSITISSILHRTGYVYVGWMDGCNTKEGFASGEAVNF